MRALTCLLTATMVVVVTLTGFAGSDVPDLKGTWVMKNQVVMHEKLDETQPKSHVDVRKGFVDVDMTITIDKQEGFRFSGSKSTAKRTEAVAGVIGFDNKAVYMVDDDGITLCRLIAPDKMEQIYLHVTPHRSVAARGILTRKR